MHALVQQNGAFLAVIERPGEPRQRRHTVPVNCLDVIKLPALPLRSAGSLGKRTEIEDAPDSAWLSELGVDRAYLEGGMREDPSEPGGLGRPEDAVWCRGLVRFGTTKPVFATCDIDKSRERGARQYHEAYQTYEDGQWYGSLQDSSLPHILDESHEEEEEGDDE